MNNKKKTIVVIVGLLLVIAIVVLTTQMKCGNLIDNEQGATSPEIRESERIILRNLLTERVDFYKDVSLELTTDSNGEYYYKGSLNSKLEEKLPELVIAYNADPSTVAGISLEEAKYGLTEGISQAFANGNKSTLKLFLDWCGRCSLVYKTDYTFDDGTIARAGEPSRAKSLSNYGYIVDRDLGIYGHYKFPWE